MALRGNPQNLRAVNARLGNISSQRVAEAVALAGASALTRAALLAYDSGTTVYGGGRPQGERGSLDLVKSGAVRSMLRFSALGRRIRCNLATKYARYLIGRYRILPSGNAALPVDWADQLTAISRKNIEQALA